MDKNRLAWFETQTYRTVCHAWVNFIRRTHGVVKPHETAHNDPGSHQFRNAQTVLHGNRGRMKPFNAYKPSGYFNNRVEYLGHNIRARAKQLYAKDRPRSTITVRIGKVKRGERGDGRGYLDLTVGYMWERRVKTIYDKGFQNDDWMILDAIQFKVNAKHIKLYQCEGYNSRLNENKVVYVAEKTIGTCKFVFGHSVGAVLAGIETAVAYEVQKEMIGENK
jgi:hypothetical protein